jgi:hypothetical protein
MINDTREVAAFVEREPRSRLILKTLRNPSPTVNERLVGTLISDLREVVSSITRVYWNRADCLRSTAQLDDRLTGSALFVLDAHDKFKGKTRQPVFRATFIEDAHDTAVIVDASDTLKTEAALHGRAIIFSRVFFSKTHGINFRDVGHLSDASTGVAYISDSAQSVFDVHEIGHVESRVSSKCAGSIQSRDAFVGRSRVVTYAKLIEDVRSAAVLTGRSAVWQNHRLDKRETARLNDKYRTRIIVR